MNQVSVYSEANGRHLRDVLSTDDNVLDLQATDGEVVFVNIEGADEQYMDEQGQLRPLPERPPHSIEFDRSTGQWIDPRTVAELKVEKQLAIEAERDRRLNEPEIIYDGKRLDADAGAKQNLQDKITAVASRIARSTSTPQQMLVWRDKDNAVHSWPDLVTYKDWLDGFAIALEDRGMQAWAWSWQKKSELAALTTVEQVLAFDPTV